MKIVVAMDFFKHPLTAARARGIVAGVIKDIAPEVIVIVKPIAGSG